MNDSRYGSDDLVAAVQELGIEYVALNPGATTRGIHDSLVHSPGRSPHLVTCLHEEIGVAIAHGYAKASGRPMAVALHDTVGLLHASMAIFNAWVDRVPMLLLTGTGPMDSSERRPWIDWVHTVQDQGEIVREFTVWNDQPSSVKALIESVRRGWQRSMTAPAGPALIGVDVLLQEQSSPVDVPELHPDLLRIGRPAPDPMMVTEVIRRLCASHRPLFVTDRPISQPASDCLVALAELTGAALLDMGGGVGFPVGHSHDVTEAAAEAIALADLLIFVEARDPGWALGRIDLQTRRTNAERPDTTAVSIGVAGLMSRSWMVHESNIPNRLMVNADPELTLTAILDGSPKKRRAMDPRYEQLAARPGPRPSAGTMTTAMLAQRVADATKEFRPVVASGLLRGWARREFRYQRAGDFLGRSGGDGLGYAAPAAVGAGLALRGSDRMTVALQADGDLLYTPQALWTAAHEAIPLLMVIDANQTYGQDRAHQAAIAEVRRRATATVGEGVDITDPPIALADMARSFGVHAEGPVRDVALLDEALRRAVDHVRHGSPAVVEVLTAEAG